MQAPQLQHDQEPAQEFGTAGVEQVLPLLPEAHGAQGIEIAPMRERVQRARRGPGVPADPVRASGTAWAVGPHDGPGAWRGAGAPANQIKASSSIGRASVSKTEGWGFDSLLACQIGAFRGASAG